MQEKNVVISVFLGDRNTAAVSRELVTRSSTMKLLPQASVMMVTENTVLKVHTLNYVDVFYNLDECL